MVDALVDTLAHEIVEGEFFKVTCSEKAKLLFTTFYSRL
jgi:hypothetical protein